MGRAPSPLSMVSVTSARPSGARPAVPAKMTSSILPPRRALAPCSPSTQAMASTTLDLPEPLGPTTQVIPGSSRSVVAEAKDLKPLTVKLLRCTNLRGSTFSADQQATRSRPGRPGTPRCPDLRRSWTYGELHGRKTAFAPNYSSKIAEELGAEAKRCAPPRCGGALGGLHSWVESDDRRILGDHRSSGQRRLGQPQNVVRLGGSSR